MSARITQMSADDLDGDGLSNSAELLLNTDPKNADSDCDAINDKSEVGIGSMARDSDGDGAIDALENNAADSNVNGTQDDQDANLDVQITCGHFKPFAIANNGNDAMRLEVRVVSGHPVTAVQVQVPSDFSLQLNGTPLAAGSLLALTDDGTQGDERAGDGIWSRNGFTSTYSGFSRWSTYLLFTTFQVTRNNGTSTVDIRTAFSNSGGIGLGLVKASAVQSPTMVRDQVYATSNLINLVEPLGAVDVLGSYEDTTRLQSITKRFYQMTALGDTFDFVLFFGDAVVPTGVAAFYTSVKNDVQHIGKSVYDASADYGSAGKLQGTIVINFGSNGPTLHELMHRWATPNLSVLGFHQCIDRSHWGVAGSGRGQLGGFDPATLVDNGNGTYTVNRFGVNANGGDSVSYTQLERYLAGFLDAGSVPPISIPTGVNCSSLTSSAGKTTFSASGINTVTIDQIKAALGGERVPGLASSQKNFRAASVIVSQYPLNGPEMTFYNEWSKNFGASVGTGSLQSFQQATGGVATMDTTISFQPSNSLSVRAYIPLIHR